MADFSAILAAAAAGGSSENAPLPKAVPPRESKLNLLEAVVASKKQAVAETAFTKIQDMGGLPTSQDYKNAAISRQTGAGVDTSSGLVKDLATLSYPDIRDKYGPDVSDQLTRGLTSAEGYRDQATTGYRTAEEQLSDAVSGVGMGVANSVGGIAALGLGLANDKAGTYVAKKLQDLNTFVEGTQSPTLQNRRAANAELSALQQRDTTAQFEKDTAKDGSLVAGLKRVGRDVLDSGGNILTDPGMLSDTVAQGAGSLITAGPMGKAVGLIGKAAGSVAPRVAGALERYTPSGTLVGIGAQEGGGAYQQTAADIGNTSHEDLAKNSPYYRDLISQGVDPEQARAQAANRAGLFAAAVQTPIAMATGRLTEHFEANPFHVPNLATAGRNLVKEGLEEGIQSGTGQVAQNLGTKTYANENQDLTAGVGDQIAQGVIGGIGSAGVTEAPGIAHHAIMAAGRGAIAGASAGLGMAGKATAKSAEALRTKNEAASPIADTKMREAVDAAAAQAPEAEAVMRDGIDQAQATPEAKAQGNEYVDKLLKANQFDENYELGSMVNTPFVNQALTGSKDKLEAMQRLGDIIQDKSNSSADKTSAALSLYGMHNQFEDLIHSDPEVLASLPDDHGAAKLIAQYGSLVANVTNTPRLQQALSYAAKIIAKAGTDDTIKPVTEESLVTPEGQQNVQTAIQLAQVAPDKANLTINEQILAHASQGKIHLTQNQHQALLVSSSLLQAAKTASDQQEVLGHKTLLNSVSNQIQTDPNMKVSKLSATAHATGVFQAVRAGNVPLATDRLKEFGNFASHMSNKVDALNKHYEQGGGQSVPYQALNPETREWYTDKVGVGITPTSPKSVEFAQRMSLEAQRLADIHNGLSKAFPALNGGQIEASQLNPALQGKPVEVAQAFRATPPTQAKAAATTGANPSAAGKTEGDTESAAKTQTKTPAKAANENTKTVEQVAPITEAPRPAKDATKTEVKSSPNAETKVEPTIEAKTPASVEVTHAVNDATNDEVAKATKPQGMDAAYPDLIGSDPDSKITNWFKAAFNHPKEARTRIIGTDSPLKALKDALTSGANLAHFVGAEVAYDMPRKLTQTYKAYLNMGDGLISDMNESLQKFLSNTPKTGDNAGKTVLERFLGGQESNRWSDGKALNITEPDGKGGLRYNQELQEGAVLAGLQWLLNSSNYEGVLDEKGAAAIAGISKDDADQELIDLLNVGLTSVATKRTLADKITQFWGLDTNKSAPAGYTEGIAESVAGEVLEALMAQGVLKSETVWIPIKYGLAEPKSINLYSSNLPTDQSKPLYQAPSLIERVVLTEPEDINHFGDERPKVAPTQLRNPSVQNTPEQKEMIKREQETPHFFSQHMADLYNALGLQNFQRLFGAGELAGRQLNENHAKSLEGKNRTIAGAYNTFVNLLSEATNRSEKAGVDLDQLPIHFAYNVSKVGRLQMLGRYSPQNSKALREVILPTRSTLDLSTETGKDYQKFALGLAQALGVKVHKMSLDSSIQKVEGLLKGALAPSVDALQEFSRTGKLSVDVTDTLLENFKSINEPLTNVALHAVAEYARYQESQDKAKFTTPIYVEADGVTNGPINAMNLLSFGKFTKDWVNRMAKGGLFFQGPKTMNEQHTGYDGKDMYQTTTDNLKDATRNLRDSIKDNVAVTNQLNHLNNLMDLFLPDFTVQDDGTIEMNRGIAKNPLTITIYGSGEEGIAKKISSAMLDSLYEQMSAAAEKLKKNPKLSKADAMFGGDESKLQKFEAAYDALTTEIVASRKGKLELAKGGNVSTSDSFNPTTFTVDKGELNNLNVNVHQLFVKPLREAITQTLGQPLMDAAKLLQQATQVQSLFQQDAFNQAVRDAIAEKVKTDPKAKAEGLSQQELSGILTAVTKQFPMVRTGHQTFFIAGSQSSDLNTTHYGDSLTGGFRTPGFVYGPTDAGVAGIPTMVIGTGDGQMMQTLATMKGSPKGSLKIFDGVNFPLDQLEESSRQANEAVHEAWQGNPLNAVHDAFNASTFDASRLSPEIMAKVAKALFGPKGDKATHGEIAGGLTLMGKQLEAAALSVEARHNAMNRVAHSIDQMAAAGSPYTHEGAQLQGTNDEEIAGELNQIYQEEVSKLQGKVEPVLAHKEQDQPKIGVTHVTGARVFNYTSLNDLTKLLNLSPTLQAVYDRIHLAQAAKDYKVVYGTFDQLRAYADTENLSRSQIGLLDNDRSTHGLTVAADKTVYLISPSKETLIHELIHAATFETMIAHYSGQDLGERTPEIAEAVKRLETLMGQFQSDGFASEITDPKTQAIYQDAQATIRSYQDATNDPVLQAAALNEFVAWGLANHKLAEVQSKVKASPLAQLAKDIMAALKTLIFGKARVSAPAEDMLSNLLFNTSILIQAQPTLQAQVRDTNLSMSTRYGDNARLAQVNETFDKKVVDYLESNPEDQIDTLIKDLKVRQAIVQTNDLMLLATAKGFLDTPQAQTTFRSVVSALATEAQIHPGSMSEAERLYTHVTKNLTVEQFMADPNSLDPAARYDAQQKYDVIVGNFGTEIDEQGRSSLLPVFLGLAITDDGFREVLAKMPLPKSGTSDGSTLDGKLENAANTIMDKLSESLAGTVLRASNVQQAIDALSRNIRKVSQDRKTIIDQIASPAGSLINRANEIVTHGVSSLADTTAKGADALHAKYNNRLTKMLATSANITASIVSEDRADKVAQSVMTAMNHLKGFAPLREFVSDLVGRTESNKGVLDLIKTIKSDAQKDRQAYRETLPGIIANKFSRKLTDAEWTSMFKGMGKTDLAALEGHFGLSDILTMLHDQGQRTTAISALEDTLKGQDQANWNLLKSKMEQLAHFMNTGEAGRNLLRNAAAVSHLLGENVTKGRAKPSEAFISAVDQLTTLYALQGLNQEHKDALASLVQSEQAGMGFSLAYLIGNRKAEIEKATAPRAVFNHYKGHIPSLTQDGRSLIVANDLDFPKLAEKSYVRVGAYVGSAAEGATQSKSYYYLPLSARSSFNQGLLQNVHQTASGVEINSGFTDGMTAGRIADAGSVTRITRNLAREGNSTKENLLPVYDSLGKIAAYERNVDPNQLQSLNQDTHLGRMIGVWRGRQIEESKVGVFNEKVVDRLHAMYKEDMLASSSNKSQYVDLFSEKDLAKDAVFRDAVSLLSHDTLAYAQSKYGREAFYVRRDMLNDALGYRRASIGDAWTGTSRWSPGVQEQVKNLAMAAFGNKAYLGLNTTEQGLHALVRNVKTLIVVSSVVVPVSNFVSNIYMMMGRGISIQTIVRAMPNKISEAHAYTKGRLREIQMDAELQAANATNDVVTARRLKTSIQSLQDSYRRMTIWPLVEAGELSSVSSLKLDYGDLSLTGGKLSDYMSGLVDKLPKSMQTAGRYALITKDTALYQGLAKSVEWGDFMAKAITYDHLTKKKGLSTREALGRVTEEFINYDRLSGRFREATEAMGLLWFYNFKIRATKVAVSTIRENPVHALLTSLIPAPPGLNGVGTALEDNIVSKALKGTLGWSIGPRMEFHAPMLNPWLNLVF